MITASLYARICCAGPDNGSFIAGADGGQITTGNAGGCRLEGNAIINTLTGTTIYSGTCYSSIINNKGTTSFYGATCFTNFTNSDYGTPTSACYNVTLGLENCSGANNTTSMYGIAKNGGTFNIQHPDPAKSNKNLVHSFVESPTAGDNIYKYRITSQGCIASLDLPSYYKFLNCNDHIHISPINHYGKGYGVMDAGQTKIDFTTDTDGEYDVILIGTRKDKAVQNNWKGVERLKYID